MSDASDPPSPPPPDPGQPRLRQAPDRQAPDRQAQVRQTPGRKQKGPFVDHCDAAKYAWCRCGRSASYPYCDGSHRGSEVTPIKVTFDKPCTVVWCACGESGNKPFCDGSHARL